MYHYFFIHSSVNGHLGFHVLAIVNNVAMNTEIHVSVSIMVFSGYMLEKEMATHSNVHIPEMPHSQQENL